MIPDYAKRIVKTYLAPNTATALYLVNTIAGDGNKGSVLKKIIDWVCWNEDNYIKITSADQINYWKREKAERYLDAKGVFWMSMSYTQFRQSGLCWIKSNKTIGRAIAALEKRKFIYSAIEDKKDNHTWMIYTINFVTLANATCKHLGLSENSTKDEIAQSVSVETLRQNEHGQIGGTETNCLGYRDKLSSTNIQISNIQENASHLTKSLDGISPGAQLKENHSSEVNNPINGDETGLFDSEQLEEQPLQEELFEVKLSDLVPDENKSLTVQGHFYDQTYIVNTRVLEAMKIAFRRFNTHWMYESSSGDSYKPGMLLPHNGEMKRLMTFAYNNDGVDTGSYIWLEDGTELRGSDKADKTGNTYFYYCDQYSGKYNRLPLTNHHYVWLHNERTQRRK